MRYYKMLGPIVLIYNGTQLIDSELISTFRRGEFITSTWASMAFYQVISFQTSSMTSSVLHQTSSNLNWVFRLHLRIET